jgi:hypothetical protein
MKNAVEQLDMVEAAVSWTVYQNAKLYACCYAALGGLKIDGASKKQLKWRL